MLGSIFQKRKKIQELRTPSLQDIKRFREVYGRYADKNHVEAPACFERSIYKAISCQKELHAMDFRQEDVTDAQIVALAETLIDLPMVSSLDLRDNRITDDGANAILEVLRLQIIAAKTPQKTDTKTKKTIMPVPTAEFTRFITSVNLKGNQISPGVLLEMTQYCDLLRREDKRLEIRAALNQIDRTSDGLIDEEDFKAVVKLLTGTEPGKKEVKQLLSQSAISSDSVQNAIALENVLLAKCSSSPTKNSACPPWEAIVQVRHANIGTGLPSSPIGSKSMEFSKSADVKQFRQMPVIASDDVHVRSRSPDRTVQIQVPQSTQGEVQAQQAPLDIASSDPLSIVKPAVRSAPSPAPLTIDTNAESPPKTKVDFRPPSSPPPALPLPPTPTSEKRDSFASSTNRFGDISSSEDSEESSSLPIRPTLTTHQLVLARQDSNDAQRKSMSVSKQQSQGSSDDQNSEMAARPSSDSRSRDDGSTSACTTKNDHHESGSSRVAIASPTRLSVSQSSTKNTPPTASLENPPLDVGDSFDLESDADVWQGRQELDDLSSLVYNAGLDSASSIDPTSPLSPNSGNNMTEWPSIGPEAADNEEEQVESVVLDIIRGGKPRNLAKVVHTEFKRGLALQDFPGDVPFRNLVALILSGNGLRDLNLFKECRFPHTIVLDLSQNQLGKVNDEDLACFPKLQVLDLSQNRIKSITGLGKLFDIRALNFSHNQIKTVINIEHLVHLQILLLRANAISAASALRLLSLNKCLTYLDLDENVLVETDERQRRKIIAHILNIVPTLSSFGSVPVIGHNTKDKKKLQTIDSPMGKSLLEHDEYPDLRSVWASNACDILQIVQDREPERRVAEDEDDVYGEFNTGRNSPSRSQKVGREQQRQKDELRSKSVGYRSRAKAPPSPIHAKTSPFAFGPPIPPPPRRSPKKKMMVDREKAEEQKRRSSQLSAPKFPPVDTNQLKQEQRRKSRPTFDVNMSVAERLQLVREKSLRRSSVVVSSSDGSAVHRSSGTDHTKRDSNCEPALVMEIRSQRSPSGRLSPKGSVVEFRVEPFPVGSPQHIAAVVPTAPPPATPVRSAESKNQEVDVSVTDTAERKPSLKESNFLQSLAVSDFLTHAEEEISTAVTALNVLLSMCERVPSDLKKLHDYRDSLDALDILNERESLDLFQRAKQHDDPLKVKDCTSAFEKLSTIKRCIKDLLKKLDDAMPGSQAIRSYCTALRATELRHIITNESGESESEQPAAAITVAASDPMDVEDSTRTTPSSVGQPNQSLNSRLFSVSTPDDADTKSAISIDEDTPTNQVKTEDSVDRGDEFDFLSDKSPFDDDEQVSSRDVAFEEYNIVADIGESSSTSYQDERENSVHDEADNAPVVTESVAFEQESEEVDNVSSLDVTQDIQLSADDTGVDEDGDFDFDTELCLDDGPLAPSEDAEPPASEEAVDAEADDEAEARDDTFAHGSEEHEDVAVTEEGENDSATLGEDQDQAEFDAPSADQEVEEQEEFDDVVEEETAGPTSTTEEYEDPVEASGAEDEDDEEAEMFGDWEKGFDPSTNHYFWFNHASGESQWVPPEGWPYEVDTPFEEDEEGQESAEYQDQATEKDEATDAITRSSADADDDLFSDNDLPEF